MWDRLAALRKNVACPIGEGVEELSGEDVFVPLFVSILRHTKLVGLKDDDRLERLCYVVDIMLANGQKGTLKVIECVCLVDVSSLL